jgi:hypothetical protein
MTNLNLRAYDDPPNPSRPRGAPGITAYLNDIVGALGGPGPLASLILFGSASVGGHEDPLRDANVLIVLHDDTDPSAQEQVRYGVANLESSHGLAKAPGPCPGGVGGILAGFADRVMANVHSILICNRSDLLSGDPARILGIPRVQAVDRVAIPSIVASAVTVWGEDLLDTVPLPAVRRLDVVKAFFSLFNQALFTAAVYPLLPDATKYAMDTLKRSVHNCYFCHHAHPAALSEEILFLEARYGSSRTLKRLLELRREYRQSYAFVLGCLPTLAWIHARTMGCVEFPRLARESGRGEEE